jgi:hypothetical protein
MALAEELAVRVSTGKKALAGRALEPRLRRIVRRSTGRSDPPGKENTGEVRACLRDDPADAVGRLSGMDDPKPPPLEEWMARCRELELENQRLRAQLAKLGMDPSAPATGLLPPSNWFSRSAFGAVAEAVCSSFCRKPSKLPE